MPLFEDEIEISSWSHTIQSTKHQKKTLSCMDSDMAI